MTRIRLNKTRLLLTAGALFAFSLSAQAQSYDNGQMMNRLNELQTQIQTLSRAVYRGDMSGAASMTAGDAAAAANNEQRMSGIEDQQRNLTGQLEKINHDVAQIKDRLDKMQADTEQRLQQLEHAAPAAAPPASSVVAPTAPASPEAPATLGSYNPSNPSAGGSGPAEAMYESAFGDVRDTKYAEAEAKFRQFIAQYPGHPLIANAQYWLGETYYVRADYKQAARTFAQSYQDYPKSGKAEASLYKLALSLAKLGKKDDACLSLRQMQKAFSGSTGALHLKAQDEIKRLACP